MIEEVRNKVIAFLNNKISNDNFVQFCRDLYSESIGDRITMFDLDAIIVLPFVHEFACYPYTDKERKSEASSFLSILQGNQYYSYSSVFKLPPPNDTNELEHDLYEHWVGNHIDLAVLYPIFVQHIETPKTIKDILNNSIYDILSKLNLERSDENYFDYVCSEEFSFDQLKQRVVSLLSYYLGISACIVQVTMLSNGSVIYTIV